ncbi:HNH endonuclease signature motif containing protein [Microbacterium sp.]|uniref:HNH endonuclease signature motif containing protein n=1 Tax=Microbacterium sp. TaxID=51671 RepID=UPI0009282DA5|nr:HNH endonuclease signature motif containing protein [Microbacterium sp.]MBN9185936.1 DUF222 domain-containing protein [Microbacterium sp.]MBN9187782.1 DUF222 domain-containing protein [Microbacterium sp.]MBN9190972.1 DUF222 domain-containing protein [Microbacterium sp.]OJU69754.1 MAG: hypothetical protein BGO04_08865 [Microbacterium sp. 70-38]
MSILDATQAPWPELAALVDEVADARARIAEQQAREATLLARVLDHALARIDAQRAAGASGDIVLRSVCAELGVAMRVSDRTVQARLGEAARLIDDYPRTHDALTRGRIERGHAVAIADAGLAISDGDLRRRYEARALEVAEAESVPRTRAAVRAIAAAIDPAAVNASIEQAQRGRSVRVYDLADGMARLLADLPTHLAYAIHDRLTRIAHDVGTQRAVTPPTSSDPGGADVATAPESDERCTDELRADILSDLLLTSTTSAHGDPAVVQTIAGRIQVTVPVLTLAGVSGEPALLAGYGPIDAATARELAAGAPGWDRVMTHPHTGLPLAVDRYRPSAELRRFLAARDEHCRFPGCRVAAWRCDIDHTIAASEGGCTACENLADFCRRHHTMKHGGEWTVRQLPGGVLEWTSPCGRIVLDRPAPTVRFVPSGDPPPF